MNYHLYSPFEFEQAMYRVHSELHTVCEPDEQASPIIRQSRFYPIWIIAKKFESIWMDTVYLDNNYNYTRELQCAFGCLFECCRYVFTTIRKDNPDENFLGMSFIFPFLTQDLIEYNEKDQDEVRWNIYHRMYENGHNDFIINAHETFLDSYMEINPIFEEIFGEYHAEKFDTIAEIVSYLRTLPDHFVPYPYNDEDNDENDEDNNDNENVEVDDENYGDEGEPFEPYIEPNSLFFDAPLRPLLGECCICFKTNVKDYIVTHCRHTACQECAVESILRNSCCWLCRTDLEERNTFLYHGSEEYHEQNKEAKYVGSIVSEDFI